MASKIPMSDEVAETLGVSVDGVPEEPEPDPNTLRFTLDFEWVPVELTDPRTGNVSKFWLHEISGQIRDKYMALVGDRIKFNKQGAPCGISNYDGMQSDLLTFCMKLEDKQTAVKPKFLQELPTRVLTQLFKRAKKMNSLDDDDETQEKAKKD